MKFFSFSHVLAHQQQQQIGEKWKDGKIECSKIECGKIECGKIECGKIECGKIECGKIEWSVFETRKPGERKPDVKGGIEKLGRFTTKKQSNSVITNSSGLAEFVRYNWGSL